MSALVPDAVDPNVAIPVVRAGLGRNTSLMASGTALSRVLGLARIALLVYAIGPTGIAADSFAIGNSLPNVLFLLIAGGVLNAVLVPQVVRAYQRPGSDGEEYVNRLLTLGTALLVGCAALLTLAAPLIVPVFSSFRDPHVTGLAVLFAYWCLPQIFFYGLYSLLGQVLNARGSFGPLMWAPVVNNVVAIAGLGVFIGVFGIYHDHNVALGDPGAWTATKVALLAGTATLGVVAQALVLLVPLHRSGFRYRPRWGLRGVGLATAGRVALWTFAGLAVGQVGVVVVYNVSSAVGNTTDGGAGLAGTAMYGYAFLVFMLPHSLVTVSLLTALFTGLSARAAAGDLPAVRADLSFGLRTVGLFTVIAAAVLMVLASPVARVLQPGASAQEVTALAGVIVAMLVGLPAFGAWSMAQRVFYAYADARAMFPIQVVMAAVVVVGALLAQALTAPRYWVVGAGIAMSSSYVVGATVALWMLAYRLKGIDARRIARPHLLAGTAAAVAAGTGWGMARLLGGFDGGLAHAVLISIAIGLVMLGVYVALLKVMRVAELDDLLRPLLRQMRRRT
ncbi:murein biosynthesis integral membrane protein MurJ [Pengzhenrongella phosphoraccumulans]|uniref:murein biosynthesis integral membrane protein MurJ n=1 Tax=Pengzhenrongella phosphoraccumulans TaxID=3114394 RepID=UPI00388FAFF8